MIARSEIQEFYSGRSVFITGASGFLGKALLEKLLRSCPNVDKVYVLLREKRGSDPKTRLNAILNSPIFDTLKKSNAKAIEKVVAIPGDITLPNLGISTIDRETLCKNVSVVIHSAASIKLNEPLKLALNVNYYGTKRIVELCEQMDSLAALVHISTAYCNCDVAEVPEKILIPDKQLLLPDEIQLMTDIQVEKLSKRIIGEKQNTYLYAKCRAEFLLHQNSSKVPIVIVRPSIIAAAWKEPEAGFVDSLCGLTGILVAIGKGMLTSIVGEKNKIGDIIPLDVTANLILASAWNRATEKVSFIPVYNCCSGTINPITNEVVQKYGVDTFNQYPFESVIRQPRYLRFVTTNAFNLFLNFWKNFLPFLFMDCAAFLSGKKPMLIKHLMKMLTAVSFTDFVRRNEWKFETENMLKLENSMGPLDREIFYWNIRDIDWKDFFTNYCLGIKKWIFKEDISNFSKHQINKRRTHWINKFGKLVVLILFVALVRMWL